LWVLKDHRKDNASEDCIVALEWPHISILTVVVQVQQESTHEHREQHCLGCKQGTIHLDDTLTKQKTNCTVNRVREETLGGKVACKHVVNVPLVKAVKAETKVVEILVHFPLRPKAVCPIKHGIQCYHYISDVSLRQSLQQSFQN
jgi:hypothetical protein